MVWINLILSMSVFGMIIFVGQYSPFPTFGKVIRVNS